MDEVFTQLSQMRLDYMLLVFLRVSGFVLASPVFGRRNVPVPAKVCMCLAFSWFFISCLPEDAQTQQLAYVDLMTFMLLMVKELAIGLVMGAITTLFFDAVFTTGQLIDLQLGFGMSNVYDPQTNASVPVSGNMFSIMLLLIFFSQEGHQTLLGLLNLTMWRIPIGGAVVTAQLVPTFIELFCTAFLFGVQMAMPMLAAGLLLEIIMGALIRSVPQMNMFVIGMPLKVLVGFAILLLILPAYTQMFGAVFDRMFQGIEQVFAGMIPAA